MHRQQVRVIQFSAEVMGKAVTSLELSGSAIWMREKNCSTNLLRGSDWLPTTWRMVNQ